MEYYKNLSLNDLSYIDELGVLQIEQWKNIQNYEDYYQASTFGRFKSLERYKKNKSKFQLVEQKILKQRKGKYLFLELNKDSVAKSFTVHCLMAMVFLNHKPNGHKLVVDHINNNRFDNRILNLQVITQRENCSKDKKSKSGFTGVSKIKDKYSVVINSNKKRFYLGLFNSLKEANTIYKKAVHFLDNGESIEHLIVRHPNNTATNITGVYKYKKKFVACVFIKSRKKQLGTYDTIYQAIDAREKYIKANKKP